MQSILDESLLSTVISIAKAAGQAIMSFYQSQKLTVFEKHDHTPVTEADLVAHSEITHLLSQCSDFPLLSEEGEIPSYMVRKKWSTYWLSDPLDGTRGFIEGSTEFTVNIALIELNRPVLGVIYAPAWDKVYYAVLSQGAYVQTGNAPAQRLRVATRPLQELRFIMGHYHSLERIQPVFDTISSAQLIRLNSSLKFAAIAQGEADVYARFGPISEWDTAAGQVILEAAGGRVVDFAGQSLQYNRKDSLFCPPFLAMGNREHLSWLIQVFTENQLT